MGDELSQEVRPGGFATNSALMAALAFVQRLVGALSTAVLAHVLGPARLGTYAIATVTANGAYGVIRLGVDMGVHVVAAHEDPTRSPERLGRILGLAVTAISGLAVLGGLALLALAGPFGARLFHQPDASAYVAIAGLLLVGQALAQCAYVCFGGLHRFGGYAAVTVGGTPLLAVATVAAATIGGPAAAASTTAGGQIVLGVSLLLALRSTARRLGVTIAPNLDARLLREVLGVGLPFYLAGLLVIPVDYLAQAGLVRLHGLAQLGDLRVVMTTAALVTFLPAALNGPMISALSRTHAGGGDAAEAFSANLRGVWTLGLAAALGLAVVWPLVVSLVFGQDYAQARAFGVIGIVAALGLCLRHVLSNSLLAFRRQRLLLAVSGLEAAAFAIVALAALPRLGLAGYLLAQAAGTFAPLLGAWLWALRQIPRAAADSRLLAATALTAAALGAAAWANLQPAAPPVAWIAAALVSALALLAWPWLVLSPAERQATLDVGARLARR
jgi:O-antigen/teichoic acid export membrane protein